MAKIWLALLLVAALGTVDPAISTTVSEVKDAWTEFDEELTSCDPECPSDMVTGAVNGADDNENPYPLCQSIKVYSDCANKEAVCSSLDTQKLDDICSTVITTTTAKTTTDGCSILQVSTLALMLSLLLSII